MLLFCTFNNGMRFYYTQGAVRESGCIFSTKCSTTKEKINFLQGRKSNKYNLTIDSSAWSYDFHFVAIQKTLTTRFIFILKQMYLKALSFPFSWVQILFRWQMEQFYQNSTKPWLNSNRATSKYNRFFLFFCIHTKQKGCMLMKKYNKKPSFEHLARVNYTVLQVVTYAGVWLLTLLWGLCLKTKLWFKDGFLLFELTELNLIHGQHSLYYLQRKY